MAPVDHTGRTPRASRCRAARPPVAARTRSSTTPRSAGLVTGSADRYRGPRLTTSVAADVPVYAPVVTNGLRADLWCVWDPGSAIQERSVSTSGDNAPDKGLDTPLDESVADTAPRDEAPRDESPRRRRRSVTDEDTAVHGIAQVPVVADDQTDDQLDDQGSDDDPPRRPKRRSRRVTRAVMTPETAGDAPLDVLAELAELRAAPALNTSGERMRLASTAVLFQAPDLSQRPRRRRVQSQAGSPEEISEAARSARDDEDDEPAPAEHAPAHVRRRRSRSAAPEAPADATEDVETPIPEPQTPGADDTDDEKGGRRRRRRRGRRSRGDKSDEGQEAAADDTSADEPESDEPSDDASDKEDGSSTRRRRRRRRGSRGEGASEPRGDEVTALRGSTRLEAKRQRRRDGRESGRRRQIITEAEFLARRESVERQMVVREREGRTQIAVLEDGVLVEHYVSDQAQTSMVGNVYLGRVQNVLPSMEAAFVDVGKGRNAVLYAGEVNWDAAGVDGQPRRIEQALKSGDTVLVQVTKDPIGHKGARLTSQVTLAGRYLVLVPGGGMTGISHKLPDAERNRLKKALRSIVPDAAGVIVRTAAEGASEAELAADIARLQGQWDAIEAAARTAAAPALLQGEPDLATRVVRDVFNDDFAGLVVSGDQAWTTVSQYVGELAPDLSAKVTQWTGSADVFAKYRIDEQLAKGMDRKVWLPSGGSLIVDRTEAMTVIDVNTGKFTGSGGTLEETVTRNNLEAAEEIVRQLRLRDIGGMIVVDFIDMVLESNRDLVLRRLVEALGRDRTKHQVAEVTSLGLVQLTRKRVGQGLVEAFSETCEHCHGRGFLVSTEPVGAVRAEPGPADDPAPRRGRRRSADTSVPVLPEAREAVNATLATIAAAAAQAHGQSDPQTKGKGKKAKKASEEPAPGAEDAVPDAAAAEDASQDAPDDAPAGLPAEDAPAQDAPADGAPVDPRADDVPADDAPAQDAPADEPAPDTPAESSEDSDGLTGGVAQP
ncbi:MAG: Rne/Rng family ribonuclease [Micrococcales bacterium]|nr:Rne/Rng family ribonuclease [Micrococcales bacterium]